MESITYATRQMIPELTKLWIEAFGDDREYVGFYFANRFCEKDMLVYLLDGKPISMISMLPAYLHVNTQPKRAGLHLLEKRRPIRYIYAVATLMEYRGRGYAKRLIQEAYRLLQIPLVLEPATKPLFDYYQRMGFQEAFSVAEQLIDLQKEKDEIEKVEQMQQTVEAGVTMRAAEFLPISDSAPANQILPNHALADCVAQDKPGMTISLTGASQRYWLLTVTSREYKRIRDEKLSGAGYVEWDEKAIAYALLENDYCGGFAYKVFHDEMEDILMYRMEENYMRIIETTLSDEDIRGVLAKLRISPDSVWVRRPVTKDKSDAKDTIATCDSGNRSFGMILGESDVKDGYLNLTLE